MFRKKVVVLGAGPAGLLAAHAAESRGWEVSVFTAPGPNGLPQKSALHGCQYLHASIPGLTYSIDGRPVSYVLDGTTDQYRRKVYGENWQGTVSPDEFGPEQDHYAWDLRAAYGELWRRWEPRISTLEVTPNMAARISETRNQKVLCTIPAPRLCRYPQEHKFVTQDVWAMGSMPDDRTTGRLMPYYAPDFTVKCNAQDSPRWYRAATVFGHSTLEWPAGPKPPIEGVVAVKKPLSTDCDCHQSPRWRRVGRYGKWRKGYLVHHVYEEVMGL